jgi:hypothetical protein
VLGAAQALFETPGRQRVRTEQAPFDSGAKRRKLGGEAFAADWAEGRAMTLEQAVAYALEEQPSA